MLIDLDAPPPVPRARKPRVKPLFPYAVSTLLAVLVLLLGGSAAVLPWPVPKLVTATDGRVTSAYLLGPETLYAGHNTFNDFDNANEGVTDIDAIPLSGAAGGKRWTTRVDGAQERLTLDPSGNTLIAEATVAGELTLLDAHTGELRWHESVGAYALAGERALIAADGLALIDVETGRTIWRRSASVSGVLGIDGTGKYAVVVDDQGEADVYAMADGKPLARAAVGSPGEQWGDGADLAVIGDDLYLYGDDYVARYQLPGLRPLWRTDLATSPIDLRSCGAGVCAYGKTGVTDLQSATGRQLWSDSRWRTVTPDGLATGGDGRTVRLDLTTGRIVRELGRGAPAGDLMLLSDGDRMWIADLASGRVLGSLTGVAPPGCTVNGDYLACTKAGLTMSVWNIKRLRPAS